MLKVKSATTSTKTNTESSADSSKSKSSSLRSKADENLALKTNNGPPAPRKLTDLPRDVIQRLVPYLEPRDVVSLGEVTKQIRGDLYLHVPDARLLERASSVDSAVQVKALLDPQTPATENGPANTIAHLPDAIRSQALVRLGKRLQDLPEADILASRPSLARSIAQLPPALIDKTLNELGPVGGELRAMIAQKRMQEEAEAARKRAAAPIAAMGAAFRNALADLY
jgi:hypothetical protein